MNLPIVSYAGLVSDKTENLSVNKRAKDRQFDAESAQHFLLSSPKNMFIEKYYMLFLIIF